MPGGQKRTASPDKTAKRFSLHFTLEYISSYIDIYIYLFIYLFLHIVYTTITAEKANNSNQREKTNAAQVLLICSVRFLRPVHSPKQVRRRIDST
jgi:hypothetical protein